MTVELAILGATPRFSEALHVGRPNIADHGPLLARFADVLSSQWLTNDGPQVRELEARLAAEVGVRHVVAMCNGTIALEIAIRALGLTEEVIVPAFTFVATAHALQWQGITPVFADVDPATHLLDPASVARLITPRTSGILGVHLWGRACDVEGLQALADEHGLALLFDAAHAFGCGLGGARVGSFGRAEVFSFHATKFFNTFEGGAVATDDDDLAQVMRLMRNFGFVGLDDAIHVGTNGKMTEICAAMGNVGFDHLPRIIEANQANFAAYDAGLSGTPGITVLRPELRGPSNFQYVVLEVDAAEAGLSRDELVAVLHADKILARRYFTPGAHRMEPYRSYFPNANLMLPVTERLAQEVLVLPTGTAVSVADAAVVVDVLLTALAHPAEVRAALATA